jgi:hypothetical protein
MDEIFDMLPDVPPLPALLVDHDVQYTDWGRWMTVSCLTILSSLSDYLTQRLRFDLQDIIAAWQQISNSSPRGPPSVPASQRIRGIRMLVEAWNHNFFLRRAIYFRFSKVRISRHRRSRGNSRRSSRHGSKYGSDDEEDDFSDYDSDSLSSDTEFDDEEDDNGDSDARYRKSRKRAARRRKESKVYRLLCEYIAPNHTATRGPGSIPLGHLHGPSHSYH